MILRGNVLPSYFGHASFLCRFHITLYHACRLALVSGRETYLRVAVALRTNLLLSTVALHWSALQFSCSKDQLKLPFQMHLLKIQCLQLFGAMQWLELFWNPSHDQIYMKLVKSIASLIQVPNNPKPQTLESFLYIVVM